jgi:hypothetical protein
MECKNENFVLLRWYKYILVIKKFQIKKLISELKQPTFLVFYLAFLGGGGWGGILSLRLNFVFWN